MLSIKKYAAETKWKISHMKSTNPNVLVYIIYGLLYDMVLNLYKPFAAKFIERIGGDEFYISLYNSLPGIIAIFALIPGAIFISRFKLKKKITATFFLISRLFILIMACVPFFPRELQPLLFVVTISIMNFPDAISQTSLQSFVGATFSGRIRAQAIVLRTKFGNIFTLLVTLITGLLINIIAKTPEQTIICYQFFYLAAFLIGILEVIVFMRFKEKEPTTKDDEEKPNFKTIATVLRDKKFMLFLLTTVCYYIAWICGWPITSVYQIMYHKANEIWLAVFVVAQGLVSYYTAGFWTKLINKKGNDYALALASLGMMGTMVFYALSANLWMLILASAYAGFAMIGMNTALLNGLLGSTPDKNRVMYIGVFNTFNNIMLGLVPYLSLYLMNNFEIHQSIYIVAAMRFVGFLVLAITYLIGKKNKKTSEE